MSLSYRWRSSSQIDQVKKAIAHNMHSADSKTRITRLVLLSFNSCNLVYR
ncbi:MAG TPA: hypothetical protein V6C57_00065 [Coleofasciculaceae cyanobacterium]